MSQGPGGRPSKFTPERCAKIVESISNRIPYKLAAEANGICETTLYAWVEEGLKDKDNGIDSEKAQFSEAIKNAEQKRINEHLQCIAQNPERWQAQAWILERRWRQYFGANAELIEFQRQLDEMKRLLEKDHGKAQSEESK